MKSKFFIITLVCALSLLMSCKDDGKNAPNSESQEQIAKQSAHSDNHEGHDHDGHDHDGHNHDGHNHDGHDHDGHNHGKSKAIENNTRVQSPAIKKSSGVKPTEIQKIEVPTLNQKKQQATAQTQRRMQKATVKLPDACTLINESFIGSVIGVDDNQITLKDGSSIASPFARSCFFRWEHQGVPNSGVMVQVQVNPVPDELDDWAAYYIQAKKNGGEKTPDGSMTFKYENFDGMGIDGAYNFDLHRYIWRDKQDVVYLVAFNLPSTAKEELTWAKKIGREVMKNTKI